jgi:hypothetical protein
VEGEGPTHINEVLGGVQGGLSRHGVSTLPCKCERLLHLLLEDAQLLSWERREEGHVLVDLLDWSVLVQFSPQGNHPSVVERFLDVIHRLPVAVVLLLP